LGLLDVEDPDRLKQSLDDVRLQLMKDPYFQDVPSMQLQARKTALAFHAKDDLPEVRWAVFRLLRSMEGLRYFAVVKDKRHVLEYVRQHNEGHSTYRYHANELYDYLVRRIFKSLLHKDAGYEIVFAKRGASDRTLALQTALETARDRFVKQWHIPSHAPLHVSASTPAEQAGLQAVDYFTWALQRLYEKGEDRYWKYLWKLVHLVQDVDDQRAADYGVYYTHKKPLTAEALAWRKQNKTPGI